MEGDFDFTSRFRMNYAVRIGMFQSRGLGMWEVFSTCEHINLLSLLGDELMTSKLHNYICVKIFGIWADQTGRTRRPDCLRLTKYSQIGTKDAYLQYLSNLEWFFPFGFDLDQVLHLDISTQ